MTVGFDDQAMPQAEEVDHIGPDRNLAAELQPRELAVAKGSPERPLRGRSGSTQSSSA
jgi:hypothetical protein